MIFRKVGMFDFCFPKKTQGIQVRLSENVKESAELNQNTLCAYGLSKERKPRMTEYISLDLSENDQGDEQLTIMVIFAGHYY